MQGLTELEHDVVGDIHQRADRADTAAQQTLLHPVGARCTRIHAAQDAAAIARAGRGRIEHDLATVGDGGRHRFDHGRDEGHTGDRRHFARDTGETQAVGAVGGELDREQRVVEGEQVAHIATDLGGLGQGHEAAVIFRETQLAGRAQHAEGFDPAQLCRLDLDTRQARTHAGERHLHAGCGIRRAADDLQQLALPGIHLAHLELVGAGVALRLDDARDDHACEGRRSGSRLLDLQPGHGQRVPERLAVELRIDQRPQPVFRELHDSIT